MEESQQANEPSEARVLGVHEENFTRGTLSQPFGYFASRANLPDIL